MSGSSGSKHSRHQRHRGAGKPKVGEKAKQYLENVDENNPTIKLFRQYAKELDEKHDRYERIIKLSRDITIESKRIIFLIHQSCTDSNKEKILSEANTRLKNLITSNFRAVAEELEGHDIYQYHRAYTNGNQEFIEALTFYQYIKDCNIEPFSNLEAALKYSKEDNSTITLTIPHYDFILGIADFTGEVMRRCISSLGVGNIDDCFQLCDYVKNIYAGCIGISSPNNKEFGRKLYTLRQSLAKMELVCYNIQIRGSEIPKHMLASVIDSQEVTEEDDEGFF